MTKCSTCRQTSLVERGRCSEYEKSAARPIETLTTGAPRWSEWLDSERS